MSIEGNFPEGNWLFCFLGSTETLSAETISITAMFGVTVTTSLQDSNLPVSSADVYKWDADPEADPRGPGARAPPCPQDLNHTVFRQF